MDTLIDNTNYYILILTSALVGVTLYYAIQTKKNVDAIKESTIAQKEATKAQFIPFIKVSIFNIGPADIVLDIINVGKGPARELEVEFYIKELPETRREWKQSLLMPNDSRRFPIPKNATDHELGIDFFKEKQITLIMEAKYKNIFDENKYNKEIIDLTAYVKQFSSTISLFQENPLDKIHSKIETISKDMSKIESLQTL
jgi:hypothetical protein